MKYDVNINGIEVDAEYSEDMIREIIEPLLECLWEMRRAKGRRVLVMLAAPPGAGHTSKFFGILFKNHV